MKKICVAFLSSALIVALLCQPAFALLYTRSSTKWVLANSFGSSSAFLTSNDTVITSYDEWCDFYPEICDAVQDGYYSGVDTAAIPFNRSFTYNGRQYLYIEIQINNWTHYLCNKSGGRFLYCSTGGTSTTPKPDLPEIELPTGTDYSSILYSIAGYISYLSSCVENLSSTIRDTLLYVSNISVDTSAMYLCLNDIEFSNRKIMQSVDDVESYLSSIASSNSELFEVNTNLQDILRKLNSVIFGDKLRVDNSDVEVAVGEVESALSNDEIGASVADMLYQIFYVGYGNNYNGIHFNPLYKIIEADSRAYVNYFDRFIANMQDVKTTLNDSLTSVISDGTLKVDNTSVVTAIQSFEGALSNLNVTATVDDTNIIKAVNTVDATLDTRLLQVYNSAERLRTTVSEGNTIQRGILNVVSTSDATLSDISEKLDKQNEYYTALSDYWGDLTTAVETQQLFLDRFDSEIFTIRQLLEKPLTVKTDLTSVTSRLDTVAGNVSDTIVVLSDISEKLDAQNEYYAALGDYWGDLSAAVSAQQIYLSNFETEIIKIRQLLEKPLVAKTDLTPVITSVDAVGLNIEDLNANFNTNIGSLLDKLDIVIEGTSESLENRINVTIDVSNDAHNVFYITGEDGETESVTEFTGDLTKASGRLLSLLYRLVFADALSTVDGDLDGFEDFFTSQGDDTATQSMESPYEEENVWLVS